MLEIILIILWFMVAAYNIVMIFAKENYMRDFEEFEDTICNWLVLIFSIIVLFNFICN